MDKHLFGEFKIMLYKILQIFLPYIILPSVAVEKGACVKVQKHNVSSELIRWEQKVKLFTGSSEYKSLLSICPFVDVLKCSRPGIFFYLHWPFFMYSCFSLCLFRLL